MQRATDDELTAMRPRSPGLDQGSGLNGVSRRVVLKAGASVTPVGAFSIWWSPIRAHKLMRWQ